MNKDNLIKKAMKEIQLTPTLEKNAHDKYHAICSYLESQDKHYDFRPQGSFQIGTVIRPYKDGKDKNYDLDVLAISHRPKSTQTPKQLKNDIGNSLKQHGTYRELLEAEDNCCWTLQYAEVSKGESFALDIVPSVLVDALPLKYQDKVVSITEKIGENYYWKYSNSLGFGEWFLERNKNFLTEEMRQNQSIKFREKGIYASIEEIPEYAYKTNLQKAIQFLKRDRDIFYDRIRSDKPTAIMVTALVTIAVEKYCFYTVSEIVEKFLDDYFKKNIPIMQGGIIINPVDASDNLAADMTQEDWKNFESWLNNLKKLFSVSDERSFKIQLSNNISSSAFSDLMNTNTQSVIPIKPWRSIIE